ncbi:MAG TPA: ECF transporter S component, partial [Kandleria vitulina]|nr:ECF transporter S component [Kandleria vitulina]
MENKKLNTKAMIMISMLGAIAALLMFFELSVPFILPFIKLDISELPVMLSGFLFGPLLGALSAVIKIAIKLIIKPTSTMYVGELSNLILSIVYQGVAAAIYRH